MLRIDHLSVRFGEKVAVDRVDLEVADGELLAVLGPSGCGKSTLLRSVAGLEPAYSGTISADGQDLAGVPTHRRGFALMFQDGQLFEHQSVGRNIGYPLRLRGTPRTRIGTRIVELLDLVGLAGYADRSPGTLSGGERQRVALARALAVEPRVLLLDEPLSALDAGLRERLALDLREILRGSGTTALLVTHDHEEAFAIADRMAVMRAGRVVRSGPLSQVWQHPGDAETAVFLGYSTVLGREPARRLARASAGTGPAPDWQSVALRRSALRVDPDGPVPATVLGVRSTPEQLRLVLDVAGIGELHAVAPLDAVLSVGQRVRARVDMSRIAVVDAPPAADPI